jgi:hypothetical protein
MESIDTMRTLAPCRFGIVLLLSAVAGSAQTTSDSPAAPGSESLGRELLDDLTPSVPPVVPKRQPNTRQQTDGTQSPAAPRFDDLGEDIGQPSGPLPLVRVRQGMQQAESLLVKASSEEEASTLQQAGEVQRQVVSQLDRLIAELAKQCQGGQCPPSDQPPQPGQRSAAKPGKTANKSSGGKTAARDSSDPLNRTGAKPVDTGDVDGLMKDLWGHLPERYREQMMQSFSDEFLPKYELEIEQYYRRLSEEREDSEME